jgi:hypothetical protein
MSVDFTKAYPWSGITAVTIDSQIMIKIPKFYVKVGTAPAGASQAGKKCWWISDRARTGYHVHPAFVRNGKEVSCFYIGAYEASANGAKACSIASVAPWVNITNPAAISACAARNTGAAGSEQYGWHLQNIYERHAISVLMLVELGTPNVQSAIGAGNTASSAAVATGTTNAVWHGIHEFWGNVWEHTDGFKTDASGIGQIFSNQGDGSYVSTSVVPAAGWIKTASEASGTNFDLKDVFVPAVSDGTEGNGTFGDYCREAANCVLYTSGNWDNGSQAGAFVFSVNIASSYANTTLGFRVAKYGD